LWLSEAGPKDTELGEGKERKAENLLLVEKKDGWKPEDKEM
jgi:hypothetical protein